jgi:hypothetical protein
VKKKEKLFVLLLLSSFCLNLNAANFLLEELGVELNTAEAQFLESYILNSVWELENSEKLEKPAQDSRIFKIYWLKFLNLFYY